MSLLSLSKSLSSYLSHHRALPQKLKADSLKLVDRLDTLLKETPSFCCLKVIKQMAYLCNYKFNNEGELKLEIAEKILSSWVKSLEIRKIQSQNLSTSSNHYSSKPIDLLRESQCA